MVAKKQKQQQKQQKQQQKQQQQFAFLIVIIGEYMYNICGDLFAIVKVFVRNSNCSIFLQNQKSAYFPEHVDYGMSPNCGYF